jgi:hypothetical protein
VTAGFETIPTGEYFFLEPEAKRFVRGETDRLPINGCMLLFLIPFVLSGLLILGLSVAQWVRISYFSSSKWAYMEGTYVGKDEIAESNGSTRYAVSFRFVVDDRVYIVEESVPQGIHDRATEGAVLRVYYRLDDPNIASVSPVSGRGGQPLGLACGTLLWWALILGLAYYVLSPMRKRQRLAREGTLISGQIIHCSGRKDRDNDLRLKAGVRFRSPQTDQWIEKNYLRTRNDLKGKPLPQPGTPVHILYINDKTFEAV